MEIYLSHMFVYRIFEKLDLVYLTGNEIVNYSLIAVGTVADAIVVAFCWSRLQKRIQVRSMK